MSYRSFYVVSVIDMQYFFVCMVLNLLNACIINLIDISILFFNINLLKDMVLLVFVHMYKMTGYYLSACSNRRDTICPRVQIDGVLFFRMCKSTGYYLSACAKMTGYYLSGVLFVRDFFFKANHFTENMSRIVIFWHFTSAWCHMLILNNFRQVSNCHIIHPPDVRSYLVDVLNMDMKRTCRLYNFDKCLLH